MYITGIVNLGSVFAAITVAIGAAPFLCSASPASFTYSTSSVFLVFFVVFFARTAFFASENSSGGRERCLSAPYYL